MENDYNKKVGDQNDRFNESLLQLQHIQSEIQRMKDEKKRAEVNLENKIKAMKEQYYDEEFNKFRGTLKIYENRLRNA